MEEHRYIIAKLEVELRVLDEEIIILENNTRKMDLPQLLTVWQPEIISSKLYIQLSNIGEEQNVREKRKKKKKQTVSEEYDGSIQHSRMPHSAKGLESGDGEGTYLSDIRRRIRDLLEDQKEAGGKD